MAPRDVGNTGPNLNYKFKHLLQTPTSLKIEFSKAASYDRFNEMFDPVLLKQLDPTGYVAKRLEPDFRRAINNGCAVGLFDENHHIRTIVVNYEYDKKKKHTNQHHYTELGSLLSCMTGFQSAAMIGAALSLSAWLNRPPKNAFVTEIKHNNIASTKIYKKLGWEPLTNKKMTNKLFYLCYTNVADSMGNPVSGPPQSEKHNIGFYKHTENTVITEAGVLLDYMNKGGVANKSGHFIPVDFSDLNKVGLTRPRLEAIAKGEISRKRLRNI